MSDYTVFKRDRCGEESRSQDFLRHLAMPIPTGHITRTDCWEANTQQGLCGDCVLGYRVWWMEKIK